MSVATELVRAQRGAYIKGWLESVAWQMTTEEIQRLEGCAKALYPLPTVTRVREVEWDGTRYRVVEGMVEYYSKYQRRWVAINGYAEHMMRIVALLANPTETMEAE